MQINQTMNVGTKKNDSTMAWRHKLGVLGCVMGLSVFLIGCSTTEQGAGYGGGGGALIGGVLGGWPGALIGGAAGAATGAAVGAVKENADAKKSPSK